MSAARRLNVPRLVSVRAGPGGAPLSVEHDQIEHVRESWLVEDRWWTDRPVRRRYWELVTSSGRNIIVFHELGAGCWYRHR